MKAGKATTELSIRPSGSGQRRSVRGRFGSLGAFVLLSAGLWRALGLAFAALDGVWLAALAIQLAAGLLLLPLCNGRWDGMALLAATAAVAAVCVFCYENIRAGLLLPANDLMDILTEKTGRIYLDYTAASAAAPIWAAVMPALLGGVFLGWSAWRGVFWPAVPWLLMFAAAAAVGLFEPDWSWALVLGGTLWLRMRCVSRGATKSAFWAQGAALVLVGAAALGVGQVADGLNDNDILERLRERVHEIRWDSETNSMPEGRLAGLGAWEKSDTPALAVTMETPQKLYLRGGIYDSYTGSRWESASAEDRAPYEDLFYWLHRRGFYAQEQVATAAALTERAEPLSMTVENLSACRKVSYLPYALYGCDELDARRIGDDGMRGGEQQNFFYLAGSVPEWYAAQQTLTAAQQRENVAEYLAAAQGYYGYVQELDLQITETAWTAIDRALDAGQKSRSLSEIRGLIRSYLAENLVYDEQCYVPSEGDFISFVLEQSGRGYSVQYATAATLMLRYYGVPARYVEGYFLSAEQAEKLAAGERVVLTEENAHAWAEYYLEGVGFVPFEVTPGYIDEEELAPGSGSGADASYVSNPMNYARVEQPQTEKPEAQEKESAFRAVWLLWLPALLLAAAIVWFAVRRIRLYLALRRIDRAETREAIALRYGYAYALMERLDAEPEMAREAAALNARARFSQHEMTEEQRQWMDDFARAVLRQGKKEWPLGRKIRYWLIDCLY